MTPLDPFVPWITARPGEPRPGPLSGVRLAVKDVIDIAGLPTGAGQPRLRPAPARDRRRRCRSFDFYDNADTGMFNVDESGFVKKGVRLAEWPPGTPNGLAFSRRVGVAGSGSGCAG